MEASARNTIRPRKFCDVLLLVLLPPLPLLERRAPFNVYKGVKQSASSFPFVIVVWDNKATLLLTWCESSVPFVVLIIVTVIPVAVVVFDRTDDGFTVVGSGDGICGGGESHESIGPILPIPKTQPILIIQPPRSYCILRESN